MAFCTGVCGGIVCVCVCVCNAFLTSLHILVVPLNNTSRLTLHPLCYCKRDQYWASQVEQLRHWLRYTGREKHDTKHGDKYMHHTIWHKNRASCTSRVRMYFWIFSQKTGFTYSKAPRSAVGLANPAVSPGYLVPSLRMSVAIPPCLHGVHRDCSLILIFAAVESGEISGKHSRRAESRTVLYL